MLFGICWFTSLSHLHSRCSPVALLLLVGGGPSHHVSLFRFRWCSVISPVFVLSDFTTLFVRYDLRCLRSLFINLLIYVVTRSFTLFVTVVAIPFTNFVVPSFTICCSVYLRWCVDCSFSTTLIPHLVPLPRYIRLRYHVGVRSRFVPVHVAAAVHRLGGPTFDFCTAVPHVLLSYVTLVMIPTFVHSTTTFFLPRWSLFVIPDPSHLHSHSHSVRWFVDLTWICSLLWWSFGVTLGVPYDWWSLTIHSLLLLFICYSFVGDSFLIRYFICRSLPVNSVLRCWFLLFIRSLHSAISTTSPTRWFCIRCYVSFGDRFVDAVFLHLRCDTLLFHLHSDGEWCWCCSIVDSWWPIIQWR